MRTIIKKLRGNRGATTIVEATIVFPIVILVLIFLIYFGNAYFIKAQVASAVQMYAIRGANYCADPILQSIRENDKIPAVKNLKSNPYRYIIGGLLGGIDDIEKTIENQVKSELTGKKSTFFKNMTPTVKAQTDSKGNTLPIAHYNNYIIYATFTVQVAYEVKIPVRMLGQKNFPTIKINARAEMPINDSAEFIRNVDMVIDLTKGTAVGQKITSMFKKINDFISNFAKK